MTANRDFIFAQLMGCGTNDLSMIDDAGIDMRDYIEYLEEEDKKPSLSDFVRFVVVRANEALLASWDREKENIRLEIEDKEAMLIKDYGEDYADEFPEDDDVQEIEFFKAPDKADKIIQKGLHLYFNCLDTHVSLPKSYIFEKYGVLDDANSVLGFTSIVCSGIE